MDETLFFKNFAFLIAPLWFYYVKKLTLVSKFQEQLDPLELLCRRYDWKEFPPKKLDWVYLFPTILYLYSLL